MSQNNAAPQKKSTPETPNSRFQYRILDPQAQSDARPFLEGDKYFGAGLLRLELGFSDRGSAGFTGSSLFCGRSVKTGLPKDSRRNLIKGIHGFLGFLLFLDCS